MRVVMAKLGEHVEGRHEFSVIAEKPLQPTYVTDRASEASRARSGVSSGRSDRSCENLVGLIQQQMIVRGKRARTYAVKVLRLHIKQENVGQ